MWLSNSWSNSFRYNKYAICLKIKCSKNIIWEPLNLSFIFLFLVVQLLLLPKKEKPTYSSSLPLKEKSLCPQNKSVHGLVVGRKPCTEANTNRAKNVFLILKYEQLIWKWGCFVILWPSYCAIQIRNETGDMEPEHGREPTKSLPCAGLEEATEKLTEYIDSTIWIHVQIPDLKHCAGSTWVI